MRHKITILIACMSLLFLANLANAQAVWERDDSFTTAAFTLADGVGAEFDMATLLGMSANQLTIALQGKTTVLGVTLVEDGVSTSTPRVRLRFDATTGTPATRLAGTTPATTGVTVQKGQTLYTYVQGAFLSIIGEGGTTANLKLARVR